jgi:hypothetical protein
MTFLDPGYRALLHGWEAVARNCVAYLRMDARRYPNDSRLAALIGELSLKDDDFRALWGSRTVRAGGHRRKHYHHPLAGEITFDSQQLRLDDEPDQYVVACTARPGTLALTAEVVLFSPVLPGRGSPCRSRSRHRRGACRQPQVRPGARGALEFSLL